MINSEVHVQLVGSTKIPLGTQRGFHPGDVFPARSELQGFKEQKLVKMVIGQWEDFEGTSQRLDTC